MYVYGGRDGSGRVFPNQTAVGRRLRAAEFPVVGRTVTAVTTSAAAVPAVGRRTVLVVQTVAVPGAVVMVVLVMVTAAVGSLEVVRGQR